MKHDFLIVFQDKPEVHPMNHKTISCAPAPDGGQV